MKYIAPIAVIGILLLQSSGAVPLSSVGGPMVLALAFFAAALPVAIHEAWTKKRGVLGWIVNIVVSFVGVFLVAEVSDIVIVPILMLLDLTGLTGWMARTGNLKGSLAATGGPLLYVSLAGMTLLNLLGAWGALWIVNRWR